MIFSVHQLFLMNILLNFIVCFLLFRHRSYVNEKTNTTLKFWNVVMIINITHNYVNQCELSSSVVLQSDKTSSQKCISGAWINFTFFMYWKTAITFGTCNSILLLQDTKKIIRSTFSSVFYKCYFLMITKNRVFVTQFSVL